jgi:hypothetical protein
MTIWEDPTTDWMSGDGLRAVQLFGLAYPDVESARAAAVEVGVPWREAYRVLPAAALWAELLRRAVESGRFYDLAADLLHDPDRAWFHKPLRDLLGDQLSRANALVVYRHGPPSDPAERRALLESADMSASSPQLVEPVVAEGQDGSLESLNAPGAGMPDQSTAILLELNARHRLALIRRGRAAVGTGFLVGPDLLLTAAHVVRVDGAPRDEDCAELEAVFDFYDVRRTMAETGISVPVARILRYSLPADDELPHGVRVEAPGNRLDYALLQLGRRIGDEPRPDGEVRGHFRIDGPRLNLHRINLTYVYHFPVGKYIGKMWTTGALTLARNGDRVRYRTNTLSGSSGGLVITPEGQPVAMHHYGTPQANQGVPIWRIAQAVSDLLGAAAGPVAQPAQPAAVGPHLALQVGNKPIVDREGFRDQMWGAMTGQNQPRQLLVVGPTDSGVSWSYTILNHVAARAPLVPELLREAPGGVRARRIDLRAYISTTPEHRCEALVREIVSLAAGRDFQSGDVAQRARFVSDFRAWCYREFEGRQRQFWLFVDSIDNIAEVARHGVDEVLTTLVDVADDQQTCLYLVLGGQEADKVGHDSLRFVNPDRVAGLSREAVRAWLQERAAQTGGAVKAEKVDEFLGRWFVDDSPAAEPGQLSWALCDALKEVRA